MDLCELMPKFYGLTRRVLVRINELDRQKKGINCMDKLYGWTRVNKCLDCMDSPVSLLMEGINWIDIKII